MQGNNLKALKEELGKLKLITDPIIKEIDNAYVELDNRLEANTITFEDYDKEILALEDKFIGLGYYDTLYGTEANNYTDNVYE